MVKNWDYNWSPEVVLADLCSMFQAGAVRVRNGPGPNFGRNDPKSTKTKIDWNEQPQVVSLTTKGPHPGEAGGINISGTSQSVAMLDQYCVCPPRVFVSASGCSRHSVRA